MVSSKLGGALRYALGAPKLGVLVVVAVVAILAVPTRGYESYIRAYEQYFASLATCESDYAPYMTRVAVEPTEDCVAVPCTQVVGEVHCSVRARSPSLSTASRRARTNSTSAGSGCTAPAAARWRVARAA